MNPNASEPQQTAAPEPNDLLRAHLLLIQTHQQLIDAASRRSDIGPLLSQTQAPLYLSARALENTPGTRLPEPQKVGLIPDHSTGTDNRPDRGAGVEETKTTTGEPTPEGRRGAPVLVAMLLGLCLLTMFLVFRSGRSAENAIIEERTREIDRAKADTQKVVEDLKRTQDALRANQEALVEAQNAITSRDVAIRESASMHNAEQERLLAELKLAEEARRLAEAKLSGNTVSSAADNAASLVLREKQAPMETAPESRDAKAAAVSPTTTGRPTPTAPQSLADQYIEMARSLHQLETDLRRNLREFRETERALAAARFAIARIEAQSAGDPDPLSLGRSAEDYLSPRAIELVADESLDRPEQAFSPPVIKAGADISALMRDGTLRLKSGQTRLLGAQADIREAQIRLRVAQEKLKKLAPAAK